MPESRKIVLCKMEKQVLVVNKKDGRNLSDWTKMFICVETVEPQQSGWSGWKQNNAANMLEEQGPGDAAIKHYMDPDHRALPVTSETCRGDHRFTPEARRGRGDAERA